METESLARFKMIKPNQMIAPGKCAGCGKFSNDDFLDFGLELEFYGVVYLCRDCLTEAAMTFGFRPDVHYNQMQAELNRTKSQLIDSLDREEAMRNALASVDTKYYRPRLDPVVVTSVEVNDGTGSIDDPSDDGEPRPVEPSNEQRSTGLFHDDSIESILGSTDLDI